MQFSPGGSAGQGFLHEVIKLRPLACIFLAKGSQPTSRPAMACQTRAPSGCSFSWRSELGTGTPGQGSTLLPTSPAVATHSPGIRDKKKDAPVASGDCWYEGDPGLGATGCSSAGRKGKTGSDMDGLGHSCGQFDPCTHRLLPSTGN